MIICSLFLSIKAVASQGECEQLQTLTAIVGVWFEAAQQCSRQWTSLQRCEHLRWHCASGGLECVLLRCFVLFGKGEVGSRKCHGVGTARRSVWPNLFARMDQVLDKIYQTSCPSKTVHASEVAILIWPYVWLCMYRWFRPRPVISKERIWCGMANLHFQIAERTLRVMANPTWFSQLHSWFVQTSSILMRWAFQCSAIDLNLRSSDATDFEW